MRNARSANSWNALGLLLALSGASCSPDPEQVPKRYRFLNGPVVFIEDLEQVNAGLPFERIQLSEVGGWFFDGPTLVLERNGPATRSGTPPKTGQISIFDFGKLCYMIERAGFESMQPRYAWEGFDAGTVTLSVWRVGSEQPMVVEDYGQVGPQEFWELCAAIEGVASRIDWKDAR